ncbi:hypothetical protein BDP81DRAFT_216160 [Colletotrichum phormii]|uniref:Uncharacterized protein n=1 Tax=Colletotrichum phormii TaxID=359342 RepID=A0AAJ0EII4_9PEZI|nr:uncharacterized protein BDP81DRAFT_216160 [Colletotrichum phormii]KAK1637990.1 hypothetical protein BDP81DRAFT_216160 [Colletotrichum phormii]
MHTSIWTCGETVKVVFFQLPRRLTATQARQGTCQSGTAMFLWGFPHPRHQGCHQSRCILTCFQASCESMTGPHIGHCQRRRSQARQRGAIRTWCFVNFPNISDASWAANLHAVSASPLPSVPVQRPDICICSCSCSCSCSTRPLATVDVCAQTWAPSRASSSRQ